MKKHVKILGAISVAALASVSIASCGNKEETSTPNTSSQSETPSSSSSSASESSKEEVTSFTIDTTNATTKFLLGEEFSSKGIVVKDNLGNEVSDYSLDESEFDKTKTGEYTIVVYKKINDKTIKGTYTVKVLNEIVEEVSTVEEFLNARNYKNESSINNLTIKLTADIDLSNVTLEPTDSKFTGSFDGNGHTISNATFTQTSSKQGLLFDKIDGGSVKNLRFFNTEVVGKVAETVGIICGEVTSGATFENLEFSMCTVNNTGCNYAGILFGRQEGTAGEINVSKITVKNLSSVSCAQYGGLLMGDILKGATLNISDCDIDGVWNTVSGNGSYLCGRTRGGNITINNVILRGEIKSDNSLVNIGFVTSNASVESLKITNLLLLDVKANFGASTATLDLIYGNKAPSKKEYKNVYLKSSETLACLTKTDVTDLTSDVTFEYLTSDSFGLSSETWESDTKQIAKIKGSSSNTPSENATVTKLIASTGNVKTVYYKEEGNIPTTDNLVIAAQYSDGCVLGVSNKDLDVSYTKLDGTVVDASKGLDKGVYNCVVKYSDKTVSYQICVAELESISLNTEDVTTAYVAGADTELDTAALHVYANYSDGTNKYVKLADASKYTLKITDSSNNEVTKLTKSGDYTVSVTSTEDCLTPNAIYTINVVDSTAVDAKIDVYVGASKENGKKDTNGNYSFKTIEKALSYLKGLDLKEEVVKTIYLEAGTYNEQISIDIPNLRLIGTTSNFENTVITYSQAAGSTKRDLAGTVGTYSSASVYVGASATNFVASNIYFKNDFDYNNSTLSDKQAVALRCDADGSYFLNCGFYGNQDTLFAKTGRQYYKSCKIYGNVDYIFGEDAVALFKDCDIVSIARVGGETNNGYVLATKGSGVKYGFLFDGCRFSAGEGVGNGTMSIARPWANQSKVAVINSTISAAYSKVAYDGSTKSRYANMSGVDPSGEMFVEYNNTGDGAISSAVNGMKFLTKEEASDYQTNLFKATNGTLTFSSDFDITGLEESVRYVVFYSQKTYKVGDTLEAPVVNVYKLTGAINAEYTEAKISDYTIVYKDASGNTVEATKVTSKAGDYTVEIKDGEVVAYTTTLSVSSDSQVTLDTYKASDQAVAVGALNDSWTWVGTSGSSKCLKGEVGENMGDSTVQAGTTILPKLLVSSETNPTDYFISKEFSASKKACVTITAGSSGTSNALTVVVQALDSNGNVVASKSVSTYQNKLISEGVFEIDSTSEFTKLRIVCTNPSGKNIAIAKIETVIG